MVVNEAWARQHLEINENDEIILPSGNLVQLSKWLDMFGGVEASYDALIAADYVGTDDHGNDLRRGYRPLFDELRARGVV